MKICQVTHVEHYELRISTTAREIIQIVTHTRLPTIWGLQKAPPPHF